MKHLSAAVLAALLPTTAMATTPPEQKQAGSVAIQLRDVHVPMSSLASSEAAQTLRARLSAPPLDFLSDIAAARRIYDQSNDSIAAEMRRSYAVAIEPRILRGVSTNVLVPSAGVTPRNAQRVLINLHGGGFLWGSGSGGLVESIPIAVVAGIKIVSVDYRLAPEHKFPSASQDVAAVYQALLQQYRPENIGLYGCSAGGLLTAQAVAWFQQHGLPRPGAIATLCATGAELEGDSVYLSGPLAGETAPEADGRMPRILQLPYFAAANANDPLVFPIRSQQVIAQFPPTLLAAGSRDFAVSSLTMMHRRLSSAGVPTELFIFDGLWHAFMTDHMLPESRELYSIIARFFDRHLGTNPK